MAIWATGATPRRHKRATPPVTLPPLRKLTQPSEGAGSTDEAAAGRIMPRARPSARNAAPASVAERVRERLTRALAPDSLSLEPGLPPSGSGSRPAPHATSASGAGREILAVLQPGDIILLRSPGFLYDTFRFLTNSPHDHAVVAVTASRVLHFAPPHAREIPTRKAVQDKYEPRVLRPVIDDERALASFVKDMRKLARNQTAYDYGRLASMVSRLSVDAQLGGAGRFLGPMASGEATHGVCTDAILRSLMKRCKPFRKTVKTCEPPLDFVMHGAASVRDFERLASLGLFEVVFSSAPTPSPGSMPRGQNGWHASGLDQAFAQSVPSRSWRAPPGVPPPVSGWPQGWSGVTPAFANRLVGPGNPSPATADATPLAGLLLELLFSPREREALKRVVAQVQGAAQRARYAPPLDTLERAWEEASPTARQTTTALGFVLGLLFLFNKGRAVLRALRNLLVALVVRRVVALLWSRGLAAVLGGSQGGSHSKSKL